MSENNGSRIKMDEEETPCRPNPKRRSTFHRRRSTLQIQSDDGLQNMCEREQEKDARIVARIQNTDAGNNGNEKRRSNEASFDLKKYIEDLKQERKTWKETLLSRKRQRKIIMKQTADIQRCEQDLDLSALSESERNFLLIRPNYEHICEKARKLSVIAAETSILNVHVTHLHNRCISRAEKKLDDVTKRVIKLID